MRFLLAALATFGVYRLLRGLRSPRGPRGLLTDMQKDREEGDVSRTTERPVADITYEIVEHDGGWAYKVNDVFSESFASRQEATSAAEQAAAAQRSAGNEVFIEYQDSQGRWHQEIEPGDDRPTTHVEQRSAPGG